MADILNSAHALNIEQNHYYQMLQSLLELPFNSTSQQRLYFSKTRECALLKAFIVHN